MVGIKYEVCFPTKMQGQEYLITNYSHKRHPCQGNDEKGNNAIKLTLRQGAGEGLM